MANVAPINVGLLVRLEAKTGHEEEVENFLKKGLRLVDDEPNTTVWFAMRLGPTTFGIFDTFPDDSGRQEHLSGALARQLMEKADQWLAEPPRIEPVDVLAVKLPALAGAGAPG
jgi:quinol monooxygenase YgiN